MTVFWRCLLPLGVHSRDDALWCYLCLYLGTILSNSGGVNAALLAAQIIAVSDPELAEKLDSKRRSDAKKVLEKDAALQAELNQ